jgi:hypothetical protein
LYAQVVGKFTWQVLAAERAGASAVISPISGDLGAPFAVTRLTWHFFCQGTRPAAE